MKKTLIYVSVIALGLVSCNKTQTSAEKETMTSVENVAVVEEVTPAIVEAATSQKGVSEADKERACSELKSWGLRTPTSMVIIFAMLFLNQILLHPLMKLEKPCTQCLKMLLDLRA